MRPSGIETRDKWKNCPLTENNDVILSMHPIISCYLVIEFVFLLIFSFISCHLSFSLIMHYYYILF